MKSVWLPLLLVSLASDRSINRCDGSFSICTATDGRPMCALDTPNTTIQLSYRKYGGICPSVLCAWECKRDPRCLEFNSHSRNWTCDLYYTLPTIYQIATDCNHFQVIYSCLCIRLHQQSLILTILHFSGFDKNVMAGHCR